MSPSKSAVMADFLHISPPLVGRTICEGLLAGVRQFPPLLRSRIGGHLCHVRFVVVADIFEILKRIEVAIIQLPQKDGKVADLPGGHHRIDLWPNGHVQPFVFFKSFAFDSDDLAESFYTGVHDYWRGGEAPLWAFDLETNFLGLAEGANWFLALA